MYFWSISAFSVQTFSNPRLVRHTVRHLNLSKAVDLDSGPLIPREEWNRKNKGICYAASQRLAHNLLITFGKQPGVHSCTSFLNLFAAKR